MNFLCTKNHLLQGLQIGEFIIGNNTNLPILNNVLIQTDKTKLNLITTNLELGISLLIPAKIKKEGSLTIPIKLLGSFIRTLPNGTLEGTEHNKTLIIKTAETISKFKGEDSTNYPILPKIEKKQPVIITAKNFAYNIQKVIKATSVVHSKPELTGVYIRFASKQAIFAATDSFRLSEKKQKVEEKQEYEFILPVKTAQEIVRIFQQDESSSQLQCFITPSQALFEYLPNENSLIPQMQIVSRMIEGDYPDYTQIIPQTWKTKIIVSRTDFLNNIKSAGLFANKLQEVKLHISPEQKKVNLQTQDYDMGEYKSSIPCTVEGEEQTITFNYQYLLDGLQNIDDEDVVIKIQQNDTPAIIEPQDSSGYTYILMPIRTI